MINELKMSVDSIKEKAENLSILYVEDEELLRNTVYRFLKKIFKDVDVAVDGEDGFNKYKQNVYDIIITDINMPKVNGIEMVSNIRKENETQEIVIVSAYSDAEYLTEAIRLGVTGYIIKPIDFNQMLKTLGQSIYKLNAFIENKRYKTQLEQMVENRTKTILELKNSLVINYEEAISSFVNMIEIRDTYTGGHSERVATYSESIAKKMGFGEDECSTIHKAGILHDIGKILTPDSILLKPGQLTHNEYSLIKEHVVSGYNILSEITMYKELAQIVYCHHEHYDGSGYPRAIKGEDIPLYARIMCVADAFDAMTTSRIYKERKTVNEALAELERLSGSWYDPTVVASAVEVLKDIKIDSNINQNPTSHIDDERFAYFYKDQLTNTYNHNYLDFVIRESNSKKEFISLDIVYIRNFTSYNKKYGWSKGDIMLSDFASYLSSEFPEFKIFRIFGDDFAILNNKLSEVKIDIDKINNAAILKENGLSCDHKHIDLKEININSYEEISKF